MSKFTALPVGTGDSFYLAQEEIRILVDGGASKCNISGLITKVACTNYLDVVICTHNDADHANGIIGLLENWAGDIKEVWVPATWTYKLKQLFEDQESFLIELIEEIYNIQDNIEHLYDLNIEEIKITEGPSFNLEDVLNIDRPSMLTKKHLYRYLHKYLLSSSLRKEVPRSLFFEAIETAERIRKIINLAYRRRGCKIRFFEFGSVVCGGISNILEPVNSKEIMQLYTYNLSVLQYLALTKVNKESLVFYACETEKNPAVLFTADSDLAFPLSNITITRPPIITAPHHGAESNKNAYSQVNSLLQSITPIWVRSDCRSKTHPGSTYKAQLLRECTVCNSNLLVKKAVEISSNGNKWDFPNNICTCQ